MDAREAYAAALVRAGVPVAGLEWFAHIGSTNDRVRELARSGAPEWTVVLAAEQAGGRGREGRAWSSPPGGLYLSVLLRPSPAAASRLPLAAGVAVADAVREHGVPARLKWPNDVLVDDRKLAGILCESASGAGTIDWVALGIGVNVELDPATLPPELRGQTASLRALGASCSLPEAAASVLAALRVWYDALVSHPESVIDAWRARSAAWWGKPVEVRTMSELFTGRAVDVDAEGALLVTTPDGQTRRVLSGDVVRLRRSG